MVVKFPLSSMPLANCLIYETDDLLATREHLTRFLCPHSIIPTERSSSVYFRHCRTSIGQIAINTIHYGTGIRINTSAADDSYLLLMMIEGHGEVKQAEVTIPVDAQKAYILNPSKPVQMKLSRDQTNYTLRIPQRIVHKYIEDETGRALVTPLEFKPSSTDSRCNATGLRNFLNYLCGEIERNGHNFTNTLIEHYIEQVILSFVLTEIPHNYSELLGLEPLGPAPEYLRRVEDFIAYKFAEPVTLQDMAVIAGVSVRTLQNSFRRFRKTTPMEYLRDYRLAMAHQVLENHAKTDSSITEVAGRCGFGHLGKFAKYYRKRYGESPSDTRRKVL